MDLSRSAEEKTCKKVLGFVWSAVSGGRWTEGRHTRQLENVPQYPEL